MAEEARERGCDQVLWLDAIEHEYVEEVGTMNLCLVIDGTLVTPPLGGSILPGITRDTVLTMARDWGLNITERPIAFDEILEADRRGTLREIFGSGTAAVVSSVGELGHATGTLTINKGEVGPVAKRLYDAITTVQDLYRAGHPQLADILRLGLGRASRVATWASRRPPGKARGARIPGVCKRRATQPGGMHRRPRWQPNSRPSPLARPDPALRETPEILGIPLIPGGHWSD